MVCQHYCKQIFNSILKTTFYCSNRALLPIKISKSMDIKTHTDNATHGNCDNSPPEQCWRGCSMQEVHRYLNEFELNHVEPVLPSEQHTVLHHYPIRAKDNEPPRPFKSHPKWDAVHVRLPCSEKSQYPIAAADGSSSIEARWDMIEKALLQPITNSHELQSAILSYNSRYSNQWNFSALHRLFKDMLDEDEERVFFEDLLPRIIRLALRLPELIQAPIPLLKQGQNCSITLSQQQISCLLANAFLCTFPRRNTLKRKSEYSTFPDINFNRLFQSAGDCVLEKIKCICHYFKRVCPSDDNANNTPTGVVTFTRRSMTHDELPKWEECSAPIGASLLHVTSEGTIEDQGLGLLQVDFANKYLGGGVLGSGCVQEEIRFVICPELLISKLFTECLKPTEALLMVGAERFSSYKGYASTFEWSGNYEDTTPRDCSRRRLTHIVAIDALAFVQSTHQYREDLMLRELNKAYVGFYHSLNSPAPGVASGNWGCGAFGGDAKLKALLQLIVTTVTKRPLVYYTFGDVELRDDIHKMHTFFIEENVQVNQLWSVLCKFQSERISPKELYDYITKNLSKRRMDTKLITNNVAGQLRNGLELKAYGKSNQITKTTPKHNVQANISQDIFESSESDSEYKLEDIKLERSQASASNCSNITDESATVGAQFASCPKNKTLNNNESGTGSSMQHVEKSAPTNNSKNRQKTLLEMLDKCYSENSQTQPSKRHCAEKIPD